MSLNTHNTSSSLKIKDIKPAIHFLVSLKLKKLTLESILAKRMKHP